MRRRRSGSQGRIRPDRAHPLTVSLFDDVDLLSLDAGNTVIFLDHARLAALGREAGHDVTTEQLIACEGVAKRALGGGGAVVHVPWSNDGAPGARGWGEVMATAFSCAGVATTALPALLERLWESHVDHNLYSKVPEGFGAAMDALRASGVKIAIVSNSEGMLEELFTKLGILRHFDAVVDSAKVGVAKPDARIFQIACERTSTTLERALHLGDTLATDIEGAINAHMRVALIDPFGHYEGRIADVPRALGVVEAANDIVARRALPR